MKILELAPYVFIEDHPQGKRNKSGLAYMIRSICDMLATQNEVHVLTQSIFTEEQNVNGWCLAKRNFATILSNFKWRYLRLTFQLWNKADSVGRMRLLLYCISAGQVENCMYKWKPDVVHIHGIGVYTLPYYLAAARCGIPVVSTLHGLVSFHSIVPASEFAKKTERLFLQMCVDNRYSMTFISTGMKQKVQQSFNNECNAISVIPNCFRQVPFDESLEKNDKVKRIICVGSIYPLKNQIQVIRVLPIVQEKLENKFQVILDIIGEGTSKEEWGKWVDDHHINGVTFCGRKPQNEVFNAIAGADLLVFPSIEEGFGIPIVEAYSCGTPVVTFSDLDAAVDIADSDCCIFAGDRSDETLAGAIIDALNREWDKGKIKAVAHNFTLEVTAKKYCASLAMQHKVLDLEEVEKLIKAISNL